MNVIVTRNSETDELQHHGIRGQRWGIRRYQNKDGSLTPLGEKRYNKEVERLKKEEAKVKAAEKVVANKKKVQTKLDKLAAKEKDLEERKNALKGKRGKDEKDSTDEKTNKKKNGEETDEERRERILNSTDPKEVYENRDVLSYNELNDRINRIDLENRLKAKIPTPEEKKPYERLDKTKEFIDKSTGLYKSVDTAVSTVANSYIGKALADALDIELPKSDKKEKLPSLKEVLKNPNKYDAKTVQAVQQKEANLSKLEDRQKALDKKANEKIEQTKKAEENAAKKAEAEAREREKQETAAEAKRQVDEYNKRWLEGESDDRVSASQYHYKQEDLSNAREYTQSSKNLPAVVTKSVAKVNDKIGNTKVDDIDYKGYEKAMKKWRKKYDNDDSNYSRQQMLDALYDIEDEFGISLRRFQ